MSAVDRTHIWIRECKATVNIHSPQSETYFRKNRTHLEKPRDVLISDKNKYADNNHDNEDCLEEIVNECHYKLLGSAGTHRQVEENC